MDLSIDYLGFRLPHPLMPGASPLVEELDTVRRLEDAGAAAIVMESLFEEQIVAERNALDHHVDAHGESFAEARSFLPAPSEFHFGPEEYLEQIRRIKQAVRIPVFGSLNGSTRGGWLDHARRMEQAGADALELNVYVPAPAAGTSGEAVEQEAIDLVAAVHGALRIPLAVKLSPFYSSFAHFARRIDAAGASGLVIFNRYYQPDIDVEELEVARSLQLSDSRELLLRLRWLAALSGRVEASLAATGGVHTALDAIKAVMAGAHAVQMVSALLRHGPEHLSVVRDGIAAWLEEHEYDSLRQMHGSMSLERCPDPRSYERANYMHILQSWPRR
jgi:dihydroorotate dehydrogenase (fumarate)